MKFKEYLDSVGIENFVPMHYEDREINGQKHRKLVPVIHNLIFVHAAKSDIDIIKSDTLSAFPIRYIMKYKSSEPLVIPDRQMQDFIAVAGTYDEQLMYLTPTEVSVKKGDRVRIKGGIWEGVEGRFVRIKRGLRVVVAIEGVMAVATASLHPSLVEVIERM